MDRPYDHATAELGYRRREPPRPIVSAGAEVIGQPHCLRHTTETCARSGSARILPRSGDRRTWNEEQAARIPSWSVGFTPFLAFETHVRRRSRRRAGCGDGAGFGVLSDSTIASHTLLSNQLFLDRILEEGRQSSRQRRRPRDCAFGTGTGYGHVARETRRFVSIVVDRDLRRLTNVDSRRQDVVVFVESIARSEAVFGEIGLDDRAALDDVSQRGCVRFVAVWPPYDLIGGAA